jgi:Flp pilus assembly protein TadD
MALTPVVPNSVVSGCSSFRTSSSHLHAGRVGAREEREPIRRSGGVTQRSDTDLHSDFLCADLLLATGRPVEAARVLEPLVAAEPGNEAALELLARSYFGSAQLQRAEGALCRLVELAPANGWARRALARTLERQSRHSDAVAHHRMADALGAA